MQSSWRAKRQAFVAHNKRVVADLRKQNVNELTPFFSLFSFSPWLSIGYTAAGTPYKVPPTQSNGAPPPYTPTPTPYPTAMYPIRSAYPQQNIYAQVRNSCYSGTESDDEVHRVSLFVCFYVNTRRRSCTWHLISTRCGNMALIQTEGH